MLLSCREIGINASHILIVLNCFTLVCNVTSVLVEVINFAIVGVDNFCNKNSIANFFKLFFTEKLQICCLQIGTINDFSHLDVQWYRHSNVQKDCLLTL